eukprot:423491-Pyramimonas_sp.AAC.1
MLRAVMWMLRAVMWMLRAVMNKTNEPVRKKLKVKARMLNLTRSVIVQDYAFALCAHGEELNPAPSAGCLPLLSPPPRRQAKG